MWVSLPLFVLFLAAPAACTPLPGLFQTGQDVKQDIVNIHNAVIALEETVQSFIGSAFPTSFVGGSKVLSGVVGIHNVNRAGFVHAGAALPFSLQDTRDVIDAVVNTVNKSIPSSAQHLKDKLPIFKKAGFSPIVIASLTLLLNDHDTFSAAVMLKTNSFVGQDKLRDATAAIANIHNAIQDAITYYTLNGVQGP